jgi:hypothetical protein
MNADFILRMNIDELNKLYKKHKTDPIKSKVIMMRIKELENRNKTYRKVKEDTINLTKKIEHQSQIKNHNNEEYIEEFNYDSEDEFNSLDSYSLNSESSEESKSENNILTQGNNMIKKTAALKRDVVNTELQSRLESDLMMRRGMFMKEKVFESPFYEYENN